MEIIRKNLFSQSEINIYFLGDIHEGNANHNKKALKQAVKIINNDKNGYWVGMGDYSDNINTNDPRFDPLEFSRKYNISDLANLPVKQMDCIYNDLYSIRNKCLALLEGNHEQKYRQKNEFDPYTYFINQFPQNNNKLKLGYDGFLKLGIRYEEDRDRPNRTIQIGLNHGAGGGGKREGYPTNKIHDLFRWWEADVYIAGHLHKLISNEQKFTNTTSQDNLKINRKWYGMSGCFLKTYQEGNQNYFEHKGKPHSDVGMLKLTIEADPNCKTKLKKIFLD